ncbi:UDP-N-acetylglucosamine/UDP-glucose/GDP-mannose transporter [Trichosurus vulpecula]|uniref:UDP-N-acetylglucosamine/UDP-glucose/GDP-mannose transporter n=1 Tax=Trichosurus vulpecula TaxID=9337 RepID=UPI00186AFE4E|nr:UDP-N-acetylglucosamine/UDP-glucose/GDP-mannose transporter [Trichosurus vulpecula]
MRISDSDLRACILLAYPEYGEAIFPSPLFLGIGQMAVTIVILYVSKLNKIIQFPDFNKNIPVKLFLLPLLYVGNHISGLSSTSKLSLPMFTILRKFTIPLTLFLEVYHTQYSLNIVVSVFAIILGAFIAAGSDLNFNLEGYIFVFLNDIFTAANGSKASCEVASNSSVTSPLPLRTVNFATEFSQWRNILFIMQFLLSCLLGLFLEVDLKHLMTCTSSLQSIDKEVLCSYYNSALTTTVVGAVKNISVAYIGMLFGGDYIFSPLNFLGLNICMGGGVMYTFLMLQDPEHPKQQVDEENIPTDAKLESAVD